MALTRSAADGSWHLERELENDSQPLSPPGVEALRESFGDPKLPEITRKITACVACRKQKIKCHMRGSQPPCTRCQKRGLSCTVNRSLQMLLEDDVTWKITLAKKVRKLSAAMDQVAQKLGMPELLSLIEGDEPTVAANRAMASKNHEARPESSPSSAEAAPAQAWPVAWDADITPASVPGGCLPELTSEFATGVLASDAHSEPDLIARGVIRGDQARMAFDAYHRRLDHFLYDILAVHDDLASVRGSSPLLTAAICTVGSLHHPDPDMPFDRCYQEFVRLSAIHSFSRRFTLDDIRALCIGAFWLKEISWILIGTAVRVATEMQLHRAFLKVAEGDKTYYLKARLFYLVYVCDHHFSVAYGRPPMTGEYEAVHAVESFLECPYAVENDARLISQVMIWSITSRVFETFGTDTSKPIQISMMGHLRRFNISLDTWRADWNERFQPSNHVGNYPRKGVALHYHFAKLYLCSHVFRGIPKGPHGSNIMPQDLSEIADTAIVSATYILRTLNHDTEIQSHLNGLPLYFDTMIAFAAVFLLRVAIDYSGSVQIDTGETLTLVQQTQVVLQQITSNMEPKHLLVQIGDGIRLLLDKYYNATTDHAPTEPSIAQNLNSNDVLGVASADDDFSMTYDFNWMNGDFGGFLPSSYDLLSPQNMQSGFDPWMLEPVTDNGGING